MAAQEQRNGVTENHDDGWGTESWGNETHSTETWGSETNSTDDWNNADWDSPKKPALKTKEVKAKQTKTISKKDSFGNDMDAWENWLNDDSSPAPSTKSRSPQPTKKAD